MRDKIMRGCGACRIGLYGLTALVLMTSIIMPGCAPTHREKDDTSMQESSTPASSEKPSSTAWSSAEPSSKAASSQQNSFAAASQPASSQKPAVTSKPSVSSRPSVSSQTAKPVIQSGVYSGIKWRSPTAKTYSLKYGRELLLINNDYELDDTFHWNLVYFSSGQPVSANTLQHWDDHGFNYTPLVDAAAYQPLKDMFAAARHAGVPLGMVSAYRSIKLQDSLFGQYVAQFKNQGLSEADAIKKANTMRTFAGTSEHNTGLGFDLAEAGSGYLRQSFGDTPQGKWLKANAENYGFILRYAKEKQPITGIIYEPWHYRYVGVEHAKKMNELGMCLEEYVDYLGGI